MEGRAEKLSVVIVRKLQTTPRGIWRALTEPELLKKWIGPGEVVAVDVEVRIGGRFRIVTGRAGAAQSVVGEYREIVPGEKLVYTWPNLPGAGDDSLVTIELTVAGDATELLIKHELLPDEDARAREELAWGRRIRRLARVIG